MLYYIGIKQSVDEESSAVMKAKASRGRCKPDASSADAKITSECICDNVANDGFSPLYESHMIVCAKGG